MKVKSKPTFSPVELTILIETEEELKVLITMFGRDVKIPTFLRDIGDLDTQEEHTLRKVISDIYNEVTR